MTSGAAKRQWSDISADELAVIFREHAIQEYPVERQARLDVFKILKNRGVLKALKERAPSLLFKSSVL